MVTTTRTPESVTATDLSAHAGGVEGLLLFDPWPGVARSNCEHCDFAEPPRSWPLLSRETREVIGGAAVEFLAQQEPSSIIDIQNAAFRFWDIVRGKTEQDLKLSRVVAPVAFLVEVLQRLNDVEPTLRQRTQRDHAVLGRIARIRAERATRDGDDRADEPDAS